MNTEAEGNWNLCKTKRSCKQYARCRIQAQEYIKRRRKVQVNADRRGEEQPQKVLSACAIKGGHQKWCKDSRVERRIMFMKKASSQASPANSLRKFTGQVGWANSHWLPIFATSIIQLQVTFWNMQRELKRINPKNTIDWTVSSLWSCIR